MAAPPPQHHFHIDRICLSNCFLPPDAVDVHIGVEEGVAEHLGGASDDDTRVVARLEYSNGGNKVLVNASIEGEETISLRLVSYLTNRMSS